MNKTYLLRVMRLVMLLVTGAFVQLSAATYSQTVTLKGKNIPLARVFTIISQQTGYEVGGYGDILANTKPVYVEAMNMPLADFLELIFKDQPLSFVIDGKTVYLSRRSSLTLTRMHPGASQHGKEDVLLVAPGMVEGVIRGPQREYLVNAAIRVKGTRIQTLSNNQGYFVLRKLPEDAVLQFSMIGFETIELAIRPSGAGFTAVTLNKEQEGQVRATPGQDVFMEIGMKIAINELDETVVQGYGATSRRLNTGTISTVTAKDLEKQPVMNPLLALRGLIPGLVVTPSGGYASSPVKLEIRGRNNINNKVSSEPLILIDGMPLTLLNLDNGDQTKGANIMPDLSRYQIAGTPSGGQSPLFGLNPMDIASITVLKDADATAIYGSRGANGVILITTKKGVAGSSRFNVNINQGISRVTRRYQLLNTAQYVELRKEALRNDGFPLTNEFAPDLVAWDTTRDVDWQKELWGGTGKVTTVNTGLSGGSGGTSFRVNGSYIRQTEILTISGGNQAANLALSLDHHTTDQKFSVSLSTLYGHTQTSEVNQYSLAASLPPNTPPMYDENGALNYGPWNEGGYAFAGEFPFGALLQRSKVSTNTANGNLILDYKPIKGLEMKASLGYNNTQNNTKSLSPMASQNPEGYNYYGSAVFNEQGSSGWSVEPQIDYANFIGPGKLSALLGATIQSSNSRYNVTRGSNYTNDILLGSILNAPTQESYDAYGQYKYAGIFARINYNLYNRYVLSLNGRRDGSSRFGPGNQFGNFGAVGLAWIVSDEKWLKPVLPSFISFFKLRSSFGVTGSDGVSDYQYLSQWSSGSLGILVPPYNGVQRPIINQHAVNQYFRWQSNKARNEAVEVGLFEDGRLSLEVSHYQNRTSNQLLDYPTPGFSGFSTVTANWPATVQNSGWEISLLANKLVNSKDFTWSANFNISFNKNILQAYPGIENTSYFSKLFVGQSLSMVYLYHYLGIDPQTGRYSFEDYNHDGILQNNSIGVAPGSVNTDNRIALNLNPSYTGGLGSQFNYKGVGLGLLFDFRKQWGKNAYATAGIPGTRMSNPPVELYEDHWQKPGDVATYPAASTGSTAMISSAGYFGQSDGVYTDASFFRLTNLSLTYSLPATIIHSLKMQGLNIYMNAQNVFVITDYKGVDPELQSFNVMPQAKIFTAGLAITF